MKSFKRLLSLILAVSMVVSMGLAAFAQTTQYTVVINGGEGTFDIYEANIPNGYDNDTAQFTTSIEENSTLATAGYYFLNGDPDLKFWDITRDFSGTWKVYVEATDPNSVWEETNEVVTTAEMFNYVIDKDVMFEAIWAGDDSDYYSNIYFSNPFGELEMTEIHPGNELETHEGDWGCRRREGEIFNQIMENLTVTKVSAVGPDGTAFIFEGWVVYNEDAHDFVFEDDGDYVCYKNNELVSLSVQEYNARYFAKFEEIPLYDYVNNNGAPNGNLMIEGNDGEFTIKAGTEEHTDTYLNFNVPAGQTFASVGVTEIGTPVFWDSARGFDYWSVCVLAEKTDAEGNRYMEYVSVPGGEKLSSEDLLVFPMPDESASANGFIYVRANWKGSDDDYYSDIGFEANFCTSGATFDMAEVYDDGNKEIYQGGWGSRLKEGFSIKSQRPGLITENAPAKADDTFDGWVIIDNETGKILAIDKTANAFVDVAEGANYQAYAFEDVIEIPVPDNNITFAAKWASVPFEGYLGNGNEGGEEGPEEGPANVIIDCYSGTFQWSVNPPEIGDSDVFRANIPEGDSLADANFSIVNGPSFENNTLEGWIVLNLDERKFVTAGGSLVDAKDLTAADVLSTADMLNNPTPNFKIAYIAKWDCNDFARYQNGERHCVTDNVKEYAFYADDNEIINIWTDSNGNVNEGTSIMTEFSYEDGNSVKDWLTSEGYTCELIPTRGGKTYDTWTLYEADELLWKEVITGTDFEPEEGYEIVYIHDEDLAYTGYFLAKGLKPFDPSMTTEEIFAMYGTKSYLAMANYNAKTNTPSVSGKEDVRINSKEGIYEDSFTTEALGKFEGVNEEEKIMSAINAMLEKITNQGGITVDINSDNIAAYEISLESWNNGEGWEKVEHEDIPAGGIEFYIEYPEDTNWEDFVFVVAHLISSGEHAGEIEILDHKETENGIKITVNSFSPFIIAYEEGDDNDVKFEEETGNNEGITDPIQIPSAETTVVVIDTSKPTEKKEEEHNPSTGAPVVNVLPAFAVICAAASFGKKRR